MIEKVRTFYTKTDFFKENEDILSQSSKYIFCFNKGDLIRRLLHRDFDSEDPKLSSSTCIRKLVRFYSFKMFIIHFQSLSEKSQDKAEKLKSLFLETHAFDSLAQFLSVEPQDRESIKSNKSSEDTSKIKMNVPTLRKSVILTYSKYSNLSFKAQEILISDLEERGSEYLKTRLWDFLQNKADSQHLLVHFNTAASVSHFMFLRHQIDNWLSEFANENLEMGRRKHIAFLVYKSEQRDVDFLGSDWHYQVIENLSDSCYRGNVAFLGQSTEDIFHMLQRTDPRGFVKKMFFKHLAELPLRKHCLDVVRNQLIPVLSHACEGGSSSEYWEIVQHFHSRLVKQIDFSSLRKWEELVFDCEMHGSVKDIIIGSGARGYSEGLGTVIRKLKKHHVITTLVSVGWLPLVLRKDFFELLLKKLSQEFLDIK